MLQIVTGSSRETEQLGSEVGSLLTPGCFLALTGGLGGGKTCFTRGIVSALAPESAHLVASPTYAIMNRYDGGVPVYHFDFYRLTGDDDVAELGFEEYFHGDGVCVVEWSERLRELLPADFLTLNFEYGGDDLRRISISARGSRSEALIDRLRDGVAGKKNFDRTAGCLI